MAAVPFLQNAIFEPAEIKAMHIAFVNICTALDVTDNRHGLAEQVAQRIVELARNGETNALQAFIKDCAS
jgi:hypothetical protein